MIYRIDVRTKSHPGQTDRAGDAVRREIAELGASVGPIDTWRIFLLDTSASRDQIAQVARELLADPVVEEAALIDRLPADLAKSRIEIHLKPGVMDPVASSTEMAIRDMGLTVREVRTGRAFVIDGRVDRAELDRIAGRVLANGVIESVHFDAYVPAEFHAGHPYAFKLRHAQILGLTDEQLTRLSREGHLFLSLPEMKAIQNYYREQNREPTDIELETIAQTWSEHCVHKTLKSAVDVEVQDQDGKTTGKRHYDNLIKETIFDSTMALMGKGRRGSPGNSSTGHPVRTDCLSVFVDNAGVIAFDDQDAVCFKAETHNHPSAIEPYGGSATGAGGVIRDILGTGLAAKPIANTDVFCVAFPDFGKNAERGTWNVERNSSEFHVPSSALPKGVIHPKRVLQQVVAGVRDYGNRMGIPTVNGAVYFDDRYLGNPLVFCGCVGLIPCDKIEKASRPGDAVVVMGGRTGRDGIHGATFSSAELTDTHADEFSHAVQIGNAITEKKMADVILQARDRNLFTAVTDCGAGGLSSAVGEMGEKVGATIDLDRVPLKYAGLRYDEIWISEAQERMVLSVPQEKVAELLALSAAEDVESTVIGTFGTKDAELILNYNNAEVGRLSMHFLHKGIPMPRRKAIVVEGGAGRASSEPSSSSIGNAKSAIRNPESLKERLLAALAHPNVASKHWIIRQYDHEVQGGSVIKPLIGPEQIGPSDAAVLRPKLNSYKGIALANGLAPHVADPYAMAVAAIDEAIRNVVAVGADPAKTAILDNFCWPSVDDERTMGTLVRACEACRDAALAHGIPFISGKDSLHNQFTNSETGQVLRIPNTLLISAIAVLDDVRNCLTMDLKHRTSRVAMVAAKSPADLANLAATHRKMAAFLATGKVSACHDVSDGGLAVAAAEMCIASGLGLIVGADLFMSESAFAETPGRYLVELADPSHIGDLTTHFGDTAEVTEIGRTQHYKKLTVTTAKERVLEIALEDLTTAWRGTLDW